jgi:hypothetical protein
MTTDDTGDGAGQTDRWLAETREENPFRWVRGSARLASVRPERRTARVDLARLCGKVPTPRGSRCDQSQGNEGGAPRSSCRHRCHILKPVSTARALGDNASISGQRTLRITHNQLVGLTMTMDGKDGKDEDATGYVQDRSDCPAFCSGCRNVTVRDHMLRIILCCGSYTADHMLRIICCGSTYG